ncbi:MAG: hypothetical protein ACRCV6_02530 [Formosimonas sp.]
MNKAQAQSNQVDYQLHTIGWKSFQDLCLTIIGEIRKQSIQAFNPVHDGGRDGAFHGKWTTQTNESISGSCTIQCKFSSKADNNLKETDLNEELDKAKRLAEQGLANIYLLYTNLSVTGTVEEKLRENFLAIEGLNHFEVHGKESITRTIQDKAQLRRLVPRVYGLGDLSQILDERAYEQASSILSTLSHDLSKFVKTSAYLQSAQALHDKHFVLLLGEPACGKTTIAATLALGAIDCYSHHVINIDEPSEIKKHWNPNEPKQLFWIDDAFGSTQLDSQKLEAWNQAMKTVNAAIDKGAKFILTSRDYIFKSAQSGLKTSACPVFNDSKVHVKVEEIELHEKEQVLYNHVKFGTQSKDFKTKIKPFLSQMAKRSSFTPELARRLGDKLFTKELQVDETSLNRFFDEPMQFLKEVISSLDTHAKSAIALIFMRGGRLESPIGFTELDKAAISTMGGEPPKLPNALNSLKDSLIAQEWTDGQTYWKYKHPTVRDAFSSIVAENSEYLDVYLTGTPIEQIMKEVSCGVEVDGAKIVVPVSRYEKIIDKINFPYGSSLMQNPLDDLLFFFKKEPLNNFLAKRCDKFFLKQMLVFNSQYLDNLNISSYWGSDFAVLAQLKNFELLPEANRLKAVQQISDLAIMAPDADFLEGKVRDFLSEGDVLLILERVKNELLPNLNDVIDELKLNYDPADSPDSHFYYLLESLENYQNHIDDESSKIILQEAINNVNHLINTLNDDYARREKDESFFSESENSNTSNSMMARSIFDDVDA